jgi:hypothetical protein
VIERVINAWGQAEYPAEAERVLAEMVESYEVKPNASVIERVINAWGQAEYPAEAERVLAEMEATYGVKPDASVIVSVIHAWGKVKNPERAESIFFNAIAQGVAPSAKAFGALRLAWNSSRNSAPKIMSFEARAANLGHAPPTNKKIAWKRKQSKNIAQQKAVKHKAAVERKKEKKKADNKKKKEKKKEQKKAKVAAEAAAEAAANVP